MLGLKMSLQFEKKLGGLSEFQSLLFSTSGEQILTPAPEDQMHFTGLCDTSTHRCTQSTQIFQNLAVLLEIKCYCVLNVSSVFLHFIFMVTVPFLEGIAQMVSIDHDSYQKDISRFCYSSCFQNCHKGGATLKPSLPCVD